MKVSLIIAIVVITCASLIQGAPHKDINRDPTVRAFVNKLNSFVNHVDTGFRKVWAILDLYQKPMARFLNFDENMKFLESLRVCPDGWTFQNRRCFKFLDCSKSSCDAVTARKMCAAENNGTLVRVLSKEDNDYLLKMNKPKRSYIFIGATDEKKQGVWLWPDNSIVTPGYHNWAKGEPNNMKQNYRCTYLSTNGFWYDYPCSSSRLVAKVPCERHVVFYP